MGSSIGLNENANEARASYLAIQKVLNIIKKHTEVKE